MANYDKSKKNRSTFKFSWGGAEPIAEEGKFSNNKNKVIIRTGTNFRTKDPNQRKVQSDNCRTLVKKNSRASLFSESHDFVISTDYQ